MYGRGPDSEMAWLDWFCESHFYDIVDSLNGYAVMV